MNESPLLLSIDTVPEFHAEASQATELRTYPRSLRGGLRGSRSHDPPVKSYRLYQCATTSHNLGVSPLEILPKVLQYGCLKYQWFIFRSANSFIPAISIAPLQVLYYSEALPTTARILYRSFTPNRTCNYT